METSIRIEVPASIYNQLVRIQENRRQAEGRKPSLASIILDLCSSGINSEQTSSANVQTTGKNAQSAGNSVQNNAADVQNTRVFQPEENMLKRLARWEESLSRWESNLINKENRLKECERDLSDQRNEIFQSKLEILDQRELSRKATLAGPEEIIEKKLMSVEIKDKDEKIKKLKDVINSLEEDIEKAKTAAKQVKEPSSFQNIIKEFWPLIIAGAGILITWFSSKKSESKKQNEQIQKLLETLERIDPGNKEKLGKTLAEGMKNLQSNDNKPT